MHGIIWYEVASIILLVCFLFVSAKRENGLYQETDRVMIFKDATYRNWKKSRLETSWLIEYYHSACGHCINFAPKFKKFASDVYDWRDTVQIGVVDCLSYHEICREVVRFYPTIIFFRRGGNTSVGVEIDAGKEAELNHALLEQLKFEDILQPYTKDVEMLPDDTVVIVDADGIVAKQIILDLRHHKRPLKWVKGKYTGNRIKMVENPKKTSISLLKVKDGRLQILKMGVLSRAMARHAIETEWNVGDEGIVKIKNLSKSANEDKLQKAANYEMMNKFPHFEDIHSSLILALRQDVSNHKVIDGEKLSALKNMLSVIREYLSFLSSYARSTYRPTFNIIATMYTLLEHKLKDLSVISSSAWKEMFDATILLPKEQYWVCCAGSLPFYRGYPCGLWTLFHSLTVMDCLKEPSVSGKNSQFLAQSVKKFVVTFFSCRECAKNFAVETKKLETVIESTCDSILWLWRIHNKVNKRLSGEPSEDPSYPKIQFPPSSLCPSCRMRDMEDIKSEQWNEEEVKHFLTIFYKPRNLRMTRNSKLLSFAANYTMSRQVPNSPVLRDRRNVHDLHLKKIHSRHSPSLLNLTNRQSTDFILCGLISLATTAVAFYIFVLFYRNHYRYRNSTLKFIKRIP